MEEKDRKILVEMIFLGLTPALAATINTVSAFTMGVGIIFIMLMSTLVMRLIRPFVTECNKYFVTLVITTLFASIFQMFTEAYFLCLQEHRNIHRPLFCKHHAFCYSPGWSEEGRKEHCGKSILVLCSIRSCGMYRRSSERVVGCGGDKAVVSFIKLPRRQ